MQKQKKSSKCSKRKTYKIYWNRVAMVTMVPIMAVALYNATFPGNVVEFEEGESEDVRQTSREIMTTNKLQDGTIHPGMTLKIRSVKE